MGEGSIKTLAKLNKASENTTVVLACGVATVPSGGSDVVASAFFLGVAIDLSWSGSNTLRIGSNLRVRTEIWSAKMKFWVREYGYV
ncbi:unnamed protein product [Linum trigynum]|uniref:Uncharacterized protein n=1 Tax=Linum trigynum TaxID=586398 RepID=A0AAV2FGE6_9ROSI